MVLLHELLSSVLYTERDNYSPLVRSALETECRDEDEIHQHSWAFFCVHGCLISSDGKRIH